MRHQDKLAVLSGPRSLALIALLLVSVSGVLPVLGENTTQQTELNLNAIHDRESPSYNSNCLSCHADVLKESSLNPKIPGIHQKMLPYTPGYSPTRGTTNSTCQKCHYTVDFQGTVTGGIRKQVAASNCALCHSPAGPGKPLYRR